MTNFSKRVLGYFVDLATSFLFYFLFFILIGLILNLFGINKGFSEKLQDLNGITQFQDQFFTYLAFFFFLLIQDIGLKNNSIFRRILNLKLVNEDHISYPKLKMLVFRNLIKALFFFDLIYFLFTKKILHDKLSKSVVIKKYGFGQLPASTGSSSYAPAPVCGSYWNQVKLGICAAAVGASTAGIGAAAGLWGCWCTFCTQNSQVANVICAH